MDHYDRVDSLLQELREIILTSNTNCNNWIWVHDMLPGEKYHLKTVLIVLDEKFVEPATWNHSLQKFQSTSTARCSKISYWMPLPTPPGEDD